MNTSNNWNWLKDLEAFQHSRDSLLKRSPTHRAERQEDLTASAEWSPAIEVCENDKEYVIRARLAEVRKEDLKVTVEKGTMTIVAHRKFESKRKTRNIKASSPLVAVSGVPSRFRMMPIRATSAPSSKTASSSCTW
jgi:HSP20 family molecular chaperone IbpA